MSLPSWNQVSDIWSEKYDQQNSRRPVVLESLKLRGNSWEQRALELEVAELFSGPAGHQDSCVLLSLADILAVTSSL